MRTYIATNIALYKGEGLLVGIMRILDMHYRLMTGIPIPLGGVEQDPGSDTFYRVPLRGLS